jgi:hypothetical protein
MKSLRKEKAAETGASRRAVRLGGRRFRPRNSQLGEEPTALALRYRDETHALEGPPLAPPTKPQRPVIQQQQQVQPKIGDEE